MIWTGTFWKNKEMIGRTEWDFQKTLWNLSERNADEVLEHERTVKDPNTKVVITNTSDNASNFVREYSLYINDMFTIENFVEVTDPWSFSQ